MIPLCRPTLPKYDVLEPDLRKIVDSGLITETRTGSVFPALFEKKARHYLGVKNAIVLPNATTGLIIALRLHGSIGKDVITPSLTYGATANAIKISGLNPVFVDVDDTGTISPSLIEESITEQTDTILPVHTYGNCCDIDAIMKIAKKHYLNVIWDSAHAFGCEYNGKKVGSFQDVEVFSLAAAKLVTTCEGGLITTDYDDVDEVVRWYKWAGNASDEYNCRVFGLSGRLSEFNALIGVHSLDLLEEGLKHREKLAKIYFDELNGVGDIEFLKYRKGCRTTYYVFPILTSNRDRLCKHLADNGISSRANYFCPPIHKMIAYKDYKDVNLPITDSISSRVLALPMYSHLPEDDVITVCEEVKKCLK